jgi:hypothetical protein
LTRGASWSAALALLATGACGGHAASAPGDVTAAGFCEAAFGELAREPPAPVPRGVERSQAESSHADAMAGALRDCGALVADVARGRLTFDARRARACADSLHRDGAASYDGPLRGETSCAGVFVGQVGAGGACAFGVECRAGLVCVPQLTDFLTGRVSPAACAAASDAAENCASPTRLELAIDATRTGCAEGQICRSTAVSRIPTPPNACFPSRGAVVCANDWDCPGTRCHLGACGSEGPAGAGGPCLSDWDCRRGLTCKGRDFVVSGETLTAVRGACG